MSWTAARVLQQVRGRGWGAPEGPHQGLHSLLFLFGPVQRPWLLARSHLHVEQRAAPMPRHLTKSDARFMGWAQELGELFLSIHRAPIAEQVRAYKQAEKRILKETRTAFEKQEMRRRIAESLLRVTSSGPWRGFSPYLRRMERLGYSSMDCRLLVCAWSAQATKGSPVGRRKTAELIADFERRVRRGNPRPAWRKQMESILTRARHFAGLEATPGPEKAKALPTRAGSASKPSGASKPAQRSAVCPEPPRSVTLRPKARSTRPRNSRKAP